MKRIGSSDTAGSRGGDGELVHPANAPSIARVPRKATVPLPESSVQAERIRKARENVETGAYRALERVEEVAARISAYMDGD
ncbi:MAG: hypothetical protein HY706_09495 [Candidatus Hydrogenedentes bacterium]|nr:hypothetical protein [Candidatus Hydrogenedentota bacterium]